MKPITKADFIAMGDDLTSLETLDEDFTVYIKRDDDKISFYSYSKDKYGVETSYWYMFSLSKSTFDTLTSANILQTYKTKFLEKENAEKT